MSTTQFSITYDGDALRSGQMDVRDLAPSLLSVQILFEEANHVLNRDRTTISVRVQSGFEKGSFDILLILEQALAQHAGDLLTPENLTIAEHLIEVVFGTGGLVGLFKLMKWLRGKKPDSTKQLENGTVNITVKEGKQINVINNVYNLYNSPAVRRSVRPLVSPLSKPGIDTFEVRRNGQPLDSVEKEELAYFCTEASGDETALVGTREALLRLVTVHFVGKRKWTFSDGTARFDASIEDREFLGRLESREVGFFKGDILHVRLRAEQRWKDTKDGPELKTRYIIERVIKFEPRANQLRLPQGAGSG